MWRHFGSIGVILICAGAAARADASISLSVIGLPTTYNPGNALTFEVGLTGAADLNYYTVGLDLTSNKGTAGADFYFASNTVQAPANTYVFSPSLGVSSPFGFAATTDKVSSTNTALVTLSDFLATGQSVADASPYTMLATVTIYTTPKAGNLKLSFDGGSLDLYQPDGITPVKGFGDLEANLASFDPTPVVAVPEPASFAVFGTLFLLAGVAVGWRHRRRPLPACGLSI
jgi:hypothetical protein